MAAIGDGELHRAALAALAARRHVGITPRPGGLWLDRPHWPRDIGRMTNKDHPPSELPLPCILDDDDIDRLLERLRAVHGEPRRDIAPGLNRQGRARKAA